MKLSVVIPCYNEAKNIPLILDRFNRVMNRSDVELILIDNGSRDGSGILIDTLLPSYPFARKVEVAVNQGYGYGILAGLNQTSGDYLGWTHADMQTDPYDIIRALELLEQNASPTTLFVKGKRSGRPFSDTIFTIGMSIFETCFLGTLLWDINAQPIIFSREFFSEWDAPPHDFSLDLYVYYLAKKLGLKVLRLEVSFPERIHGQSSWNTDLASKWKFIMRTLQFSVRLKKGMTK